MDNLNIDVKEIIKRVIKYLLESTAIAIAARYIPQHKLNMREIIMIAITGAVVFALLDMFSPTVSSATRTGAGLGIGLNLIS